MCGGYLARFRLPHTCTPEAWLHQMAKARGIDKYQKHHFLYNTGGDINRVEYFPHRNVYEAQYHWD